MRSDPLDERVEKRCHLSIRPRRLVAPWIMPQTAPRSRYHLSRAYQRLRISLLRDPVPRSEHHLGRACRQFRWFGMMRQPSYKHRRMSMAAHWSRGLSRADAQTVAEIAPRGAWARRRAAPLSRIIDVPRNAEGATAVPVGNHSSALPSPFGSRPRSRHRPDAESRC
jgi:hypothetical protein